MLYNETRAKPDSFHEKQAGSFILHHCEEERYGNPRKTPAGRRAGGAHRRRRRGRRTARPPGAAASRTVTETYASPRHGNETGLGTVWLYEAEKIQSSQSLTSGQYIAMTKDANGNYVGEAGNKATIRVNESQNKAAYPMAATIEENAVLAFARPAGRDDKRRRNRRPAGRLEPRRLRRGGAVGLQGRRADMARRGR